MAPCHRSELELKRQIERLREERDLSRARHIAGGYKPAIVVDDLRWLLDKEENGGSLAAGAAKEVEAELREVEEGVTKLRIAYGTLRNQSLRKTHKVEALEEELRLVLQQNAETAGDRKFASDVQARHAATMARVEQMEQLAEDQVEYTKTLNMLIKRLREEKGGGNELLDKLRQKMSEYDVRKDRQLIANNGITHAGRQAKNVAALQASLNENGRRARQRLVETRKDLVARSSGVSAKQREELKAQQAALKAASAAEDAEEATRLGLVMMQTRNAEAKLRHMEDQFRRVQQLMGFADIDAVVARIIEQKEAGGRMKVLKGETMERHEALVEEKARLELAREEQRGGVDSELSARRHEYDEFVQQEEAHAESISKRRGRVEELIGILMRARVGISQIDTRLAVVPRLARQRARSGWTGGGSGGGEDESAFGGLGGSAAADPSLANGGARRAASEMELGIGAGGAYPGLPTSGGGAGGDGGGAGGGGAGGAGEGGRSPPNSPPMAAHEYSSHLESMREQESYMVRALAAMESELVDLLSEVEKNQARAAAAAAAGHPLPGFSAQPHPPHAPAQAPAGSTVVVVAPLGGGEGGGGGGGADGPFFFGDAGPPAAAPAPAPPARASAAASASSGLHSSGHNPFGANNVRVASELSAWEAERLADRSNPNGAIERTFAELNRWHDEERAEIRRKTLGLLPPARGAIDLRSGGAIDDSVRGGGIAGGGGGGDRVGSAGGRRGGAGALSTRDEAGGPTGSGSQSARPATSDGQSRGGASRPGSGTLTERPVTANVGGARSGGVGPRAPNKPQPPKPSPRTGRGSSASAAGRR